MSVTRPEPCARVQRYFLAALATASLMAGCGGKPADSEQSVAVRPDATGLQAQAAAVFRPLPAEINSEDNPVTDAKVNLGRMLYYDTRLSQANDLSCNSCHGLETYGVDNRQVSADPAGRKGRRNALSTYNAALHIAQFWDGRAVSVEAQAKTSVIDPLVMGMPDAAAVEDVLRENPGYVAAFKAAFPDDADPVTFENMGRAIGAFERRLLTPSPFDKFLAGDLAALNNQQLAGLQAFIEIGCALCHGGMGVGGGMYQKLGLVKPYPTTDTGRAEVTRLEPDKFIFKVPSLRNIEKTAPYFHDGAVARLDQAIRLMAEHQRRKKLTYQQVADIKAFLGSLTGTIPAAYIAKPPLP